MEAADTMDKDGAVCGLQTVPAVAADLPSAVGRRRRAGMERSGARTALLCVAVAVAIVFSATRPVLAADPPSVTITGGSTDRGHNYTWTVTNRHTSPIVSITFPHYRATVFDVPERWDRDCTHLLKPGSKDKPGTCMATSTEPRSGIERGASATFTMRVWQSGTQRTRGTVSIGFADGAQVEVSGVEVAAREAFGDRYVTLLGLGSIFLVWLLVRAVRGKKASRHTPTREAPPETNG